MWDAVVGSDTRDHHPNVLIGEDISIIGDGHQTSVHFDELVALQRRLRKTVVFDVKPGEHVRYQCVNKAHWTAMMFMAFLGAAFLTVTLVREKDPLPPS